MSVRVIAEGQRSRRSFLTYAQQSLINAFEFRIGMLKSMYSKADHVLATNLPGLFHSLSPS